MFYHRSENDQQVQRLQGRSGTPPPSPETKLSTWSPSSLAPGHQVCMHKCFVCVYWSRVGWRREGVISCSQSWVKCPDHRPVHPSINHHYQSRHMRHMIQHWSITSTHHHQHQQISLTLAHLAALLCSVHYLRKHSQINCIFKEMNTCLEVVGVRID